MSVQVENCAIEDNNYSPIFATSIDFSITEKMNDYRIKDFLFTGFNNSLYKKLIDFGKTRYSLSFFMSQINTIAEETYYFLGSGSFDIGWDSSKNSFSTMKAGSLHNFLQLSINIGRGYEIDYYQGTFI